MNEVVGVKFESSNRLYFFERNSLDVKKGDKVVVETEKGVQFGEVFTNVKSMEDKHLTTPLKKIIRLANEEDINQNAKNQKLSVKALDDAKKKCKKVKFKYELYRGLFYFR